MVAMLKEAGLVVMPTVGARRHAEKVAEWGVDAVLCQGGEGGGHTGSVPTSLLLPQVLDAVDIPVIAAGGFHDGRGLAAALAWGADGIAMGTRFLLTADSKVPDEIKQAYLATPVTGTVVSTAIDGAPTAGHPHRDGRLVGEGRHHPLAQGRAQRPALPQAHRHARCATCCGRGWP